MILTAQFEHTDTLPPAAWNQMRAALVHVLETYGVRVNVREDRESEHETYQRFWAWAAEERARRG